MPRRIFGYKNRLWIETHHYDYTGSPEIVNLNAGEYLLMCRGAHGGSTPFTSGETGIEGYHGGVSYGVLTLNSPKTLYAYVGGNGEDANPDHIAVGGYNGGGNGGDRYSSSYDYGAAGGGATDIRLKRPEDIDSLYYPTIPDEYQQVEYVTFNRSGASCGYIDTGIVTTYDYTFLIKASTHKTGVSDMILFGNDRAPGNYCWFDYYSSLPANRPEFVYHCASYNYSDIGHYQLDLTDDTPAIFNISRGCVYVNGQPFTTMNYTSTGNNSKTLYLGAAHNTQNTGFIGNIYYFKMWDAPNNNVIAEYVPCYRKSDNVIGFWDTVTETFFTNSGPVAFTKGPDGSFPIMEYPTVAEEKELLSLKTRIITAGGGGGAAGGGLSGPNAWTGGFGGGFYGGPCVSDNTNINTKYNYITARYYGLYSGDFSFNGLFGKGWNGGKQTSSAWSVGGGGGGYIGGVSPIRFNSGVKYGGGGGSGFVYNTTTKTRLRTNINIPDEFLLTDTFQSGMRSWDASISICEPFDYMDLLPDDVIEFPSQNDYSQFTLVPGNYTLKCWGGSAGKSNWSSTARGGYAEGTVDIMTDQTLYAYVGGAGDNTSGYADIMNFLPDQSFNGGGLAVVYGGDYRNGQPGGGASDIRLFTPDEFTDLSAAEAGQQSLLSRFIVAGGAGGGVTTSYPGGSGGGMEGGSPDTSTGAGVTPGPGTQTGTPQDSTYTDINGGFGYGGNSHKYNATYSGGAGGGGWFGGSGTAATNTSYARGGCGGSGYVLTSDSFRPDGYLVPDDFILSNTQLITGGNDLHYGMTKIEVTCNILYSYKILCKDSDGLKYFNDTNQRWEILNEPETVATFETYGTPIFVNDVGLKKNYRILLYDPDNYFNTVNLEITPPKQTITTYVNTRMYVSGINVDYEGDTSVYDFKAMVRKQTESNVSQYKVTVTLEKNVVSNNVFRLYMITSDDD